MATKLEIINKARNYLGELSVNTLDLSDPILASMSNMYDLLKDSLLSSHDWKFAMKWSTLTRTQNDPLDTRYQFSYNTPVDCLKLLETYPWGDYEILSENIAYTNCSDTGWKWKYVYPVNESNFPRHFQQTLAYALAADSAMLVTQNATLFQVWEGKYQQQYEMSEYLDSISEPSPKIMDNPMSNARYR